MTRTGSRALASTEGLSITRNGDHAWTVRLRGDEAVIAGGRTRAAAIRTANILLNRRSRETAQ